MFRFGKSRQGSASPPPSSTQPPKSPPVEEATEQLLNKQAKLRSLRDAIALGQMAQIAQDEIEDVRRLKAKHLGEQWAGAVEAGGDDVGDIIVCDDYHQGNTQGATPQPPVPQPSVAGFWPAALAALGLGMGGLALFQATRPQPQPQPPAVAPAPPAATPAPAPVRIETKKGFLIELVQ